MIDGIKKALAVGMYGPTATSDITWLVKKVEDLQAELAKVKELLLGDALREKVVATIRDDNRCDETCGCCITLHAGIEQFQQAAKEELEKVHLTPQATKHDKAVIARMEEVDKALKESAKNNKPLVGDLPEDVT